MQVAQNLANLEHFVCHATLGVLTLGRSPTGFPLNPIWTSVQIWDTGSSSWPASRWTCLARDTPLHMASPVWTSVRIWDTARFQLVASVTLDLFSLGVGCMPPIRPWDTPAWPPVVAISQKTTTVLVHRVKAIVSLHYLCLID